jgi:YVTN family beta-propeller protein/cysteine-rich repeat protein
LVDVSRHRRFSWLVLHLALAGAAILCAAPARAWLVVLPSEQQTAARALAIAPDERVVAAGDVAFGSVHRPAIFRINPSTGLNEGIAFPGFTRDGHLNALALAGDDAIVGGAIRADGRADEFLVARAAPNGFDGWLTELTGGASCGDDVANAVALDPEGGVIAAGMFTNVVGQTVEQAFAVVKLNVVSGAVFWRTEIPDGVARAIVMDGFNPIVVGTIGGELAVVKLASGDGKVLWQKTLGAGDGHAAVLGAPGEVYAAGQLGGSFTVVKLETDTGSSLWNLPSGTLEGPGVARAVTRLSDGDVVAAGELGAGAGRMFTTARFAAADGSIDWVDSDQSIPSPAAAYAVAHDDLDDLVSVGTAADPSFPASFSARSVFGADGGLLWGTGILSDEPETRALAVLFDENGDVLIGGQLGLFGFRPSFAVQKLDGATGEDFQSTCGNHEIDPGEDCDDGNSDDGDCCSSTCTFEPAGQDCDTDSNDCTNDTCDGEGTCQHLSVPDGTSCDDGNDCTDGDSCTAGECFAEGLTQSGTPCNADLNPCTTDTCNGDGGCVAVPNTDPCNDFNACTTGDTCNGQGFCQGVPQQGGGCDDGNDCTANDACVEGFCRGSIQQGAPCDNDDNPCTNDVCNSDGFCTHGFSQNPCTDFDSCTTADHCENGACTGMPVNPGSTTTTSTTVPTTTSSTSSTTSSSSTSSTTSSSTSTTAPPVPTTTSTTAPVPTTTTSTSSTSTTSSSTTSTVATTSSTTSTVATTSSTTSTVATTSSTTSTAAPTSTTSSTSTTTAAPTTSTIATTTTTSSTTSTTLGQPGPGCADGTREGLVDAETFPNVAACAGSWSGDVTNGSVLCEEGWHVCNPDDAPVLQTVSYQAANAFAGCFAYDAADDNNQCLPCAGTLAADDMAGMGQGCGYHAQGAGSCISGGRIDTVCCGDYASGTACQFKPGLTTGAVCCKGGVATTSTTSTTVPTSSTIPATTTTSTSTTSTSTLPPTCTTSADCDDGDPCNGGEACTNGRCLASRGKGGCEGPDPLAAITSFDADVVTFVNVRTHEVDGSTPVGRGPWGVAWSPDGTRIWVTNRDAKSVSVIDVLSRTVVGTVAVGGQPLGIAVHPFLPRAYVTSYDDDRLRVVDTSTLTVVDTVQVGNGPAGVAIHPAGGYVYVANYIAGTVSVINVATDGIVDTVHTPALPVGIAVAPDGTKAYVACFKERSVAILGTVSNSLLGTIRVGRKPVGVAFDATQARAYVTNSADDTLTVIDTTTDKAIAKLPVGDFPLGVAVADDSTVFVAEGKADDVAFLEDGAGTSTLPMPKTPVAIGSFIGTPPGECARDPLLCDDANPYTGDACTPGVGCSKTPIEGLASIRAGIAAMRALIEDAGPNDPFAAEVAGQLGALESALSAAETGASRDALKLVRRTLKPILKTLESARRHGSLGDTGARLLDIAREARDQLKRLVRSGG